VGAAGDRQHDRRRRSTTSTWRARWRDSPPNGAPCCGRCWPAAATGASFPPDADLDMLVEIAYGVLWYRVLISHAALDAATARRLAGSVLSAGR
jgi:hypothetical protein